MEAETASARWAATARMPLQRRTQTARAAGRKMASTLAPRARARGSKRTKLAASEVPAAPNFDAENYQAAPACGAELRVGLTAIELSWTRAFFHNASSTAEYSSWIRSGSATMSSRYANTASASKRRIWTVRRASCTAKE